MNELSHSDIKEDRSTKNFIFDKLSRSKQVLLKPVFELPSSKNLRPESTCLELVNLQFHICKIKNRIQSTTHVAGMDSDEFLPLASPYGWNEINKGFFRAEEHFRELNKRIKGELIDAIDVIAEEIRQALVNNNRLIDENEFPFLKLSPVEQAIVAYMLMPDRDNVRHRIIGSRNIHRNGDEKEVGKIISALSDRFSEVELRQALEPDSTLISEDLITVDVRGIPDRSWDRVDVIINYAKIYPFENKGTFFNSIQFQEIITPKVNLSDLELSTDLKEQIDGILSLYKKGKISPLSFLFFGESGSGKTSLVHAIAKELGHDVVMVRDYLSSEKNLPSTIHFLMRKYRNKKVLILFDECENLWYENSFVFERSQSRSKEKNWSKHLLENPNGIVAFTSNFAPPAAFLRRVTLAAELATPNDDIRAKILVEKSKELCSKLKLACNITPEDFKSLSQTYDFTGAFLERAVTLSLVYSENELTLESLEKALKSIMTTSGKTNSESSTKDRGLVLNDKQCQIIEAIKNILERKKKDMQDPLLPKSTSLMLYGPPGTGKTEFAKALSNKLNLKLKMTSASDFLSKYIGESEKNIAHVFKQASKNKEILFIDEVEGLFMGRESAQRSWELTQIGEFLKQIESFDGVLVVATNHKEMIDQAFSRRFIFQLEFGYPEFKERIALLKRFVGNKLPDVDLSELANELEFSPGELRNAAALWSVFDCQTGSDLSLKIKEQMSARSLQKSRQIGF